MKKFDLIATAVFGLESEVAFELKSLGYEDLRIDHGKVLFRGDASAVARCNLWLRCADRVLIEVARFPCKDFTALYDGVHAVPWKDLLPSSAFAHVTGRSVKSQITSVPALQRVTKKAIVDVLRVGTGRSELPETGVRYPVHVALRKDEALLTLDTSGQGLHKRGYRDLSMAAPLKETLAAGLIRLSRWKAERPFLDPFCGSGTLAIEAGMIARNIAPGRQRGFLAEDWPLVPVSAWREAREEADDLRRPSLSLDIRGSDRDRDCVTMARRHAKRAGLEKELRFVRRDFAEVELEGEYGVCLSNPPYGERIGEREEVEALYRLMGERLGRLESWSVYVLTSREDFEELYGKPASKKRKLFNGKLRCNLFQYHGPRPPRISPAKD